MATPNRIQRLLVGTQLAGKVIGGYGMTLTRQHSGDNLQKIFIIGNMFVESRLPHPAALSADIYVSSAPQPRYFRQLPRSSQMFELFRSQGWDDGAIPPVQVLLLSFGTLGAIVLFVALNQLVSPGWAFGLSMGLALTFWQRRSPRQGGGRFTGTVNLLEGRQGAPIAQQ